jgi:hypothetical protein
MVSASVVITHRIYLKLLGDKILARRRLCGEHPQLAFCHLDKFGTATLRSVITLATESVCWASGRKMSHPNVGGAYLGIVNYAWVNVETHVVLQCLIVD